MLQLVKASWRLFVRLTIAVLQLRYKVLGPENHAGIIGREEEVGGKKVDAMA